MRASSFELVRKIKLVQSEGWLAEHLMLILDAICFTLPEPQSLNARHGNIIPLPSPTRNTSLRTRLDRTSNAPCTPPSIPSHPS